LKIEEKKSRAKKEKEIGKDLGSDLLLRGFMFLFSSFYFFFFDFWVTLKGWKK
jgi:hypothetical protein